MKNSRSKLGLNKLTISNLSTLEMSQKAGGVRPRTNFGGDCGTFKTFDCSAMCTIKL